MAKGHISGRGELVEGKPSVSKLSPRLVGCYGNGRCCPEATCSLTTIIIKQLWEMGTVALIPVSQAGRLRHRAVD